MPFADRLEKRRVLLLAPLALVGDEAEDGEADAGDDDREAERDGAKQAIVLLDEQLKLVQMDFRFMQEKLGLLV